MPEDILNTTRKRTDHPSVRATEATQSVSEQRSLLTAASAVPANLVRFPCYFFVNSEDIVVSTIKALGAYN